MRTMRSPSEAREVSRKGAVNRPPSRSMYKNRTRPHSISSEKHKKYYGSKVNASGTCGSDNK